MAEPFAGFTRHESQIATRIPFGRYVRGKPMKAVVASVGGVDADDGGRVGL
ncbi:hypothetical protein TVNIR_3617 [Thioalkalivibrio nitratireducens DSM 14787]|uniref:Uncharacterized protein n=1 Tax=Thioalkalivibrio nitratireducens (strain DSM 14787 / UNIQEM 213 / ALEN2) TaxID=1255043 RepID=L0E1X7_THIND|nr:hypothetical protein [Thioalkalivibrio nitratireducens]AGA35247.1 hypothetical protein TVNIR_3617 [Thioalkalivibrio nitratireducens DSM 14787]